MMSAARMLGLCVALALCVGQGALAPELAHAQEADPAARAQAQRAARAASRHYNAGRYDRALEGYERAYALFPAPGLLFNLGQCHRELGHHERAIEHFERYLRERPDASNADVVRELVRESRAALPGAAQAPAARAGDTRERSRARAAEAELEAARLELERARSAGAERLEAQSARYEAALAELEQARAALEETRVEMLERAQEAEAARALVAEAPAAEVYEEWWFWTLIAGVVLAVGAGITIGILVTDQPALPFGSLGTIDAR